MSTDPDVLEQTALAAAEELRQKRETERTNLSKNQLKKARRKLTKLYAKVREASTEMHLCTNKIACMFS